MMIIISIIIIINYYSIKLNTKAKSNAVILDGQPTNHPADVEQWGSIYLIDRYLDSRGCNKQIIENTSKNGIQNKAEFARGY
jgi:hypothetical protein